MKKFFNLIMVISFLAFMTVTFMSTEAYADPRLMWNASTGVVDGYRIYHGEVSGEYPIPTDVRNVTTYPLDGLITMTEGVTYYFVVRAYNVTGESGNSNQTEFTVPVITPSPPTNLEYFEETITWTAPANEFDSYRIYYTINGDVNGVIPVAGDQTTVATPLMQCGTKGYYYIVSVWDGVESPQSDLLSLTMLPCTPTNLEVVDVE